ncbi:MAG: septum formation initiator family protein [Anaerolineae bacterium]
MAQAILVLALVLLVPLAIEYTRQAALRAQWLQAEVQVQAALATAQALQATLEARKAYVQTDAYVEEAARARLKMARPGEVIVVIVGTQPAAVAFPTPQPTATPTKAPWWQRLLGN